MSIFAASIPLFIERSDFSRRITVEFNATPLFEDVSYVINKKDRIALVGKNGAGKSTMLKILAGLQSPTRGVIAIPRDVTIGYLPQVMILADNHTVMEEAEQKDNTRLL